GGAFHDRENVALNALAGNVRSAVGPLAIGNLVDLVDEDDAAGFRPGHRLAADPVHVDQPRGLLLLEHLQSLRHLRLALLGGVEAGHVFEELLQVDANLLHPLAAEIAQEGHSGFGDLDLDVLIVQGPGSKLSPQLFAIRLGKLWRWRRRSKPKPRTR